MKSLEERRAEREAERGKSLYERLTGKPAEQEPQPMLAPQEPQPPIAPQQPDEQVRAVSGSHSSSITRDRVIELGGGSRVTIREHIPVGGSSATGMRITCR